MGYEYEEIRARLTRMLRRAPCWYVAFVDSMAGPAVPGGQVLELQERLLLGSAGLPPDKVEAQVATVRKLVELVRAQDYTGARARAPSAGG